MNDIGQNDARAEHEVILEDLAGPRPRAPSKPLTRHLHAHEAVEPLGFSHDWEVVA